MPVESFVHLALALLYFAGNHMPMKLVVQQLLQHVGSTCLHQLNSDLLHSSLGRYFLQQGPGDLVYLSRLCDITERAVEECDERILICALIALQVSLRILEKCEIRDRILPYKRITILYKIEHNILDIPLDQYIMHNSHCSRKQNSQFLQIRHSSNTFGNGFPQLQLKNGMLYH